MYLQIENALSRNGRSLCIYEQFLAFRNIKDKCFEIVDVVKKETMLQFQYEDAWYYNNYHVLGHIFVFPHFMKVTLFDANDDFNQIETEGMDFDWYKNEDEKKDSSLQTTSIDNRSPMVSPRPGDKIETPKSRKKFVILKNTNTICFDRGDGRIQVYTWEMNDQADTKIILFNKTCSLNNHSLCEVIDKNIVTVIDFRRQQGSQKKLYNVETNRIETMPEYFAKPDDADIKTRTFTTLTSAFSMSSSENKLSYMYDQLRSSVEVVNHDCIDYIFYYDRNNESVKIVSFMEQNEQYFFQISCIAKLKVTHPDIQSKMSSHPGTEMY